MYGIELTVLLPLFAGMSVHARATAVSRGCGRGRWRSRRARACWSARRCTCARWRSPDSSFPDLDLIVSATAPLDPALARLIEDALRAPLLEMFGSTETCVFATRRTAQQDVWRLYDGVTLERRRRVHARLGATGTSGRSSSRTCSSCVARRASCALAAIRIWSRSPANAPRWPTSRGGCAPSRAWKMPWPFSRTARPPASPIASRLWSSAAESARGRSPSQLAVEPGCGVRAAAAGAGGSHPARRGGQGVARAAAGAHSTGRLQRRDLSSLFRGVQAVELDQQVGAAHIAQQHQERRAGGQPLAQLAVRRTARCSRLRR